MDKTELFICECHDVNHQLILSVMDDEPIIYGHYHLDNYGFMNRIKNAIKYIIAKGRFEGDFDNFLFNINDIDRFKSIISILDEEKNTPTLLSITPEREYTELNCGKKWEIQEYYKWTFESKDNIYVVTISKRQCLSNPEIGEDIEIDITPNMGKASLTKRIIRGCKHICDYRSCFGEFDAFELTKEDFPALNKFIQIAEVVKS